MGSLKGRKGEEEPESSEGKVRDKVYLSRLYLLLLPRPASLLHCPSNKKSLMD